ncbi:MAG: cytochrome c peroxidase [Mariprofundaceae bacterium]
MITAYRKTIISGCTFILLALLFPMTITHAADVKSQVSKKSWQLPRIIYPTDNPNQKVTEELGRLLFFDPRLSGSRENSCASCHHPGLAWTDPLQNIFRPSQLLERNTPSLINIAYQKYFFWDGRSSSLEGAVELHLKEQSITKYNIPALPESYHQKFQQAFGSPNITSKSISKALANFLRTIVIQNSPFDQWVLGDDSALSQSAERGYQLFIGKAQCIKCHTPPHFSDAKFHHTGANTLDPGHISSKTNHSSFRTPSLRQVSRTAPYMHIGNQQDLESVIQYYLRGGDRHSPQNELRSLNLSEQEQYELLDFIISLTGNAQMSEIPILPMSKTGKTH